MHSTSAQQPVDLQMEIAHLLLIDVVGYSKLLVNEQIELLQQLNHVVRGTECFRAAEQAGKLIRLPTGDGMALLFFRSPEEPVQCALEIARALRERSEIRVRMGVHSGPVNQVKDVNDRINIAGAGINIAQRVMDCGDAGHILMSKHVADDLGQYRHWQPYLRDLGQCEVKHGLRLHVFNLCKDDIGNAQVPEKFRRGRRWKPAATTGVRPIAPHQAWRKYGAWTLSIFAIALVISTVAVLYRRNSIPRVPRVTDVTAATDADIPAKSIAVLPFANLSDEKENAFFAEGMQDEILTDLSKLSDLKVISRASVMAYKSGVTRNLRQIAQMLGVAHILEGSVQRAGSRVRVTAQLIDTRTDAHVWAERYDAELADVFAIQSEIAQKIADQLKAKLSVREKAALSERPTNNLVAYDRYLRAKTLMPGTTFSGRARDNLLQAVNLLNDAIVQDPAFFLAYYQLAIAHDRLYFLGLDHTPARLALAEKAIQKMTELRPDAGETHLARAQHLYRGYLDYEQAHGEFAIAQRSLPNDALVYELMGYAERRQGRWKESTAHLQHALELDPRNLFILQQVSLTYQNLRQYADAAAMLDRALSIDPSDIDTRVARAAIDLPWQANLQPLRETIDNVLAANPDVGEGIDDILFMLALCERDAASIARALATVPADGINENSFSFPRAWCEAMGARALRHDAEARRAFERARTELEKTVRDQPDFPRPLVILAMVDAALGQKENALREGRRAVELLPVNKDALNGAYLLRYLAIVYAWTGESDLALDTLTRSSQIPGDVSYGNLRLHPYWDPLRGDPRFEKIVASLAPK